MLNSDKPPKFTNTRFADRLKPVFFSLLCGWACLMNLQADHGKDFALLDDYYLPEPFHGTLIGNFDWTSLEGDDELAFEQGFLFGLAPRLAAGVSLRFADNGAGSWDYESITPSAQIQPTEPQSDFPGRLALSLAYTFAEEHRDTEDEAHEHDHGIPCGPEYGPNALPCDDPLLLEFAGNHSHGHGHDHHHDGIHRHGENAFRGRLIAQAELPHDLLLVANLIAVLPEDGGAAWGYGVGIRHAFNHDLAAGLEASGDFDRDGEHTVLAGLYLNVSHALTLKLAAGARITDDDVSATLVGGYTWRFRPQLPQ